MSIKYMLLNQFLQEEERHTISPEYHTPYYHRNGHTRLALRRNHVLDGVLQSHHLTRFLLLRAYLRQAWLANRSI